MDRPGRESRHDDIGQAKCVAPPTRERPLGRKPNEHGTAIIVDSASPLKHSRQSARDDLRGLMASVSGPTSPNALHRAGLGGSTPRRQLDLEGPMLDQRFSMS